MFICYLLLSSLCTNLILKASRDAPTIPHYAMHGFCSSWWLLRTSPLLRFYLFADSTTRLPLLPLLLRDSLLRSSNSQARQRRPLHSRFASLGSQDSVLTIQTVLSLCWERINHTVICTSLTMLPHINRQDGSNPIGNRTTSSTCLLHVHSFLSPILSKPRPTRSKRRESWILRLLPEIIVWSKVTFNALPVKCVIPTPSDIFE